MTTFLRNLAAAVRGLSRSPAFTLASVVTLALGIGATTAMFSAVRNLVLRPPSFPDPERLVAVYYTTIADGGTSSRLSVPDFLDLQQRTTSFESVASYRPGREILAGGDLPEMLPLARVSAGFFEVLGLRPTLGSFFAPAQGREASPKGGVVVLSHGLWTRRFGADRSVVGRGLVLGGHPYTIVGVAPPEALLPAYGTRDLYVPEATQDEWPRALGVVSVIGRLKKGVSRREAQAEIQTLAQSLAVEHPAEYADKSLTLLGLHEAMVGDTSRPLMLLMGSVALLLLTACANVANLLLAKVVARQREVAVRVSLGATRRALFHLFLAEGMVVATAGAVGGLLVAHGLLSVLPAFLPQGNSMMAVHPLQLDGSTLAAALTITLLTTLVFGLLPVLICRELAPAAILRSGSRAVSRREGTLRTVLVVGEVGMAVLLLLLFGLLLHSFVNVLGVAPGFDPRQVIVVNYDLPELHYEKTADLRAFQREIVRRLGTLHGVASVGLSWSPPVQDRGLDDVVFQEAPSSESPASLPRVTVDWVDGGYFETLRIPTLSGRPIDSHDVEGASPAIVVNRSFARRFFPGEPVLGRRLRFESLLGEPDDRLWEIVGIVGDTRNRSLESSPRPRVFLPIDQAPRQNGHVVLRASLSAGVLANDIRKQVAAIDPGLALVSIADLDRLMSAKLGNRRQPTILLAAFAIVALLLAGVGVHGVLAFLTARRTREIGIRTALGASRGQILRPILSHGLGIVALGSCLGLLGYSLSAPLLSRQLFGLSLLDPPTLLAVPSLMVVVALLACLSPALRALRVEPSAALRED